LIAIGARVGFEHGGGRALCSRSRDRNMLNSFGAINMNIVDVIKEQISGELLGKLASALGSNEATTTKAVSGAVPTILSVLANLASSAGGADKLISSLRRVDAGAVGNVIDSLRSGNTKAVEEKGGDLLGSLLGGGSLASIVNIISQFAGLGSGSTKSLLSLLAPLVLGAIANHFKTAALNPHALTSFFEDQKSNITRAMPAGLSIPNLQGLTSAARDQAAAASSALPAWLLPLVAVGALALLGWWFLSQQQPAQPEVAPPGPVADRPAPPIKNVPVPDSPDFVRELTNVYSTATETLAKVKDVATAEAAVPDLKGLVSTLDTIKPLYEKLPDSAKSAVAALQSKNLGSLKDLIAKVLAITGVGEKLKPILDDVVAKLSAFT
jgi:hypothetical protein